ncbi:hypothetical protein ABZY57_12040 [Streptomyces sp. NPDC006450]|uniref:hypothetical protein n=1 Tax=Streptomyces sp. NPDC006450 TaxID=3155458 RepID=UPI0033BA0349
MNIRRTLATLAATTVAAPAVPIAAPTAVARPVTATPVAADPFATCTSWTQSARTTSELVGFPTRLVAGAWSTFTFRSVNVSASPLDGGGRRERGRLGVGGRERLREHQAHDAVVRPGRKEVAAGPEGDSPEGDGPEGDGREPRPARSRGRL